MIQKFFLGKFNKSVILTYVGVMISLFGLYQLLTPNQTYFNVTLAMICLILSGICDLFDGKIARLCNRTEEQKQFGIQIDSLADVVSFLIFPTVFLMYFNNSFFTYLIAITYIICGITRLAWFNITTNGNTIYYNGLPVTYIALILPLFYAFAKNVLSTTTLGIVLAIIYVLVSLLFIINVKIKKPTGKWYIAFSIIAILTIILLCI